MTITIGNVRQFIAVLIFVSIVLAGVAVAAQDEAPASTASSAMPYITATQAVSGLVVRETDNPVIVQDMFLAAVSTPERNKIVNHTPRVTARTMYVTSTGYNSEVEQTDDSPFIAADGSYVYDGMVAANFLPFGTKIKIPDYFGDKIFTVHDRMNKRYWERVDVWFPEHSQAIQWGARTVKIEILGS